MAASTVIQDLPLPQDAAPWGERSGRPSPLLKWAGGKEQELKHILPLVPSFARYFEPFVGGGAVYFALQPQEAYINDMLAELVSLYRMVAEGNDEFFRMLDTTLHSWRLISELADAHSEELIAMYERFAADRYTAEQLRDRIYAFVLRHAASFNGMFETWFNRDIENFLHEIRKNLISKTARMKKLERERGKMPPGDVKANLECALKSAFYMHFRYLYNHVDRLGISPAFAAAIFFFVRENAYASMFRYNSRGEFNVPYGGLSYNRKDLARKVAYLKSPALKDQLERTRVERMDFADFLRRHAPGQDDFIFLDPPYDSDFSTYARNQFTLADHRRLADYLLDECQARFMLVIKNTPAIQGLYGNRGLTMLTFDKKYLVSFQDRNDKRAKHFIIMNYPVPIRAYSPRRVVVRGRFFSTREKTRRGSCEMRWQTTSLSAQTAIG